MANPAPTINQINAFNATQGTIIDFNIIGGTELVRSNRIYIYDLSDNSLICTHLYVSTESIHELPPNTDGSIVYESGKSSADFVNGAQYYAQIQTFTDIAGTEGGSGLSVAKMFWCLVDPTLTITTIPSTISTTSYNVSATYNANTSVVSNIIQQYQFSLYSATGSLLQSSGVVVGNGTQQGTSTVYDISYNFSGLSVGSSYYVVVDVTTTQGMSVTTQSGTFTVSIDTPTLGEATVVNNACDGYISVTSNLSGEYGGSGSGEIVSFETDSENVFTKLQVDLEPIQDLHGYDAPWVGGAGKNKLQQSWTSPLTHNGITFTRNSDGSVTATGATSDSAEAQCFIVFSLPVGNYYFTGCATGGSHAATNTWNVYMWNQTARARIKKWNGSTNTDTCVNNTQFYEMQIPNTTDSFRYVLRVMKGTTLPTNGITFYPMICASTETDATYAPYENICPISGHDEVDVEHVGKNLINVDSNDNQGAYIDASGVIHSSNSWTTSGLIPIDSSKPYVLSGLTAHPNTGIDNYRLYDATKNYIGSITKNATNYPVTFANNVAYVQFCWKDTDKATVQFEQNTTATSYEPYNGTTYHEDFEVIYTPTVQENEAYLFKQTGDVGGDRENIELVGGTVAWNQLLDIETMGAFIASTKSYDSSTGVVTVTPTNYGSNSIGFYTTAAQLRTKANHVYFTSVDINPDYSGLFRFGVEGSAKSERLNAGSYQTLATIAKRNGEYSVTLYLASQDWTTGVYKYKNGKVIDLTQMFGSTIADYIYSLEQANAGDGVAFFRSLFPKAYYPYNAGELISVKTSSHDTVGFNAWDEQWELGALSATGGNATSSTEIRSKNYIPVVGGQTYYLYCAVASTFNYKFYDADKNFISGAYIGRNNTLTIPNDARYMRFYMGAAYGTTYNNDICINLSWDGERDGEYEEYVKHSYPLDSSLTLRGIPKLDNGNLYYDGDRYKANGDVDRRFGTITIDGDSTIKSSYNNQGGTALCVQYEAPDIKQPSTGLIVPNWIVNSSGLAVAAPNYQYACNEDTISVPHNSANRIVLLFKDTTTADAVKQKLTAKPLTIVYELATPTEETADPFEEIQKVTPIYGTEEFVDSRTIPMPVGNNTQYLTRDIYGGYIDLVSGVLTVTHSITTLTSGMRWNTYTQGGAYIHRCIIADIKVSGHTRDYFSSHFYQPSVIWAQIESGQMRNYAQNVYNLEFCLTPSTTSAQWKAYLDEQVANGTPVQLYHYLATPQTYQLTPQQIQTLVGQNNVWSEQGEISLAYHIPITNLLVKRQDVDDVSGAWLTLYSQSITQASDMNFTFIDFTNQYGKTYKYALVPLLTQQQSGVEVEVEGGYTVSDEVQSIFDGVFIADQTGLQKCKANVGYGDVDMNQAVGTITPIGSKYPVVITNSKNQYHNGSISGTIVPDDYYFNGNLSRIDMVNKRNELEQFLTNKRAKIIKDWNSNIWLVMIIDNINCSFDNNYGMGMVNFNASWIEVGDPTNQQDLQAAGLIDVGGA